MEIKPMIQEKIAIEKLMAAQKNKQMLYKKGDWDYKRVKYDIKQFGFWSFIVFNKTTGNVLTGDFQKLNVMRDLAIAEVECTVIEFDIAQEKALCLALRHLEKSWERRFRL